MFLHYCDILWPWLLLGLNSSLLERNEPLEYEKKLKLWDTTHMRDFIWGNKGGIRLELDSCGIPLFCRKISLRVEADTFTSHKVRHSAASLKLSNTNDLKQRIFCKASIRNAYYFHKRWTLPAQWIKCSNGDMIMIASCRLAIFVNMIKTTGRSKPEGTDDDDEEKD